VLGLAYSSLSSLGTLSDELNTATSVTARKTELAGQIETSGAYLRTAQRGVILYSVLKEPAMVEKSKVLFASHSAEINAVVDETIRPSASPTRYRALVRFCGSFKETIWRRRRRKGRRRPPTAVGSPLFYLPCASRSAV